MPEFLQLKPPQEALAILLATLPVHQSVETVILEQALNRVTAKIVTAPISLPSFRRSTVDGYAVLAADTYGASDGLPAYFRLIGEIPMGAIPDGNITIGEAMLIHTGGMLPTSADAVVMIENTQSVRAGEIEVLRAVAVGENILKVGEDVVSGQVVIDAGVRLRPAEVGGLAALGIERVEVVAQPRVAILSTGDEVRPLGATLSEGEVYDVNSFTLGALVTQTGGVAQNYGILPDRIDMLEATAKQALADCDVVIIAAGSSASTRDITSQVINSLGEPGVLVHGVSVRPGKPTILGVCQGKAVIGLPGNPVSALVIAGLFVVPVLRKLLGLPLDFPSGLVCAQLALNIPSQAGREDWIPVRLVASGEGWLAEPIFGKSNLIFTLARANGLVRIPASATGINVGETVDVHLI